MTQHNAIEITERLSNVQILIGQGITVREISKQLNVSVEQIYKDIRSIKKQGLKFLQSLNNQECAYIYQVLLASKFNVHKRLWEKANDNSLAARDHIMALKAIIETDISIEETIKNALNIFVVEQLKTKVESLESAILTPQSKNYMNLKLPELETSSDNK